ncbi:uncharacterized protein L969DRAFT_16972 [Mixia osmundae IAM 14324]|uniref:Cation/H+ exchanger transmembrane domain-containing protein n=1 Tax=Mixia osmundae (strain CBS 9802 / IAM 14324 / JCM 22182 / KY 12970) TaxID=764103 RepID=G7E2S5_MIXOS|nr:uncharacterized protein L969DRAFT_16972 [Mixia osmundae IAM 14324]KEI40314.1 hypothetical protein L969DRAFT_16972 [Mixia osmundae IAM 14324]GAA97135.1 hypothetical protein E5Q_03810 [Mixia osmundae IAM 14324]
MQDANYGGMPPDTQAYGGEGDLAEAHHALFRIGPEVNAVHLAYTLIAVFIVVFGTFSAFIKERLFIGEAIISTAFGIAFSQHAAKLFEPNEWGAGNKRFDDLILEVTRVVIALSVFAVGVELPKSYVLRHWRSLAFLLGPVMLFGWLISGGLVTALIPGFGFLHSLVIAACVTPTDPILAASVVGKGKFAQEHVPSHIRHVLQAESGCNDGAAFPFLYLAMFLLLREESSVGHSIGEWILTVVLYQIVLGVVMGAAIGIIARKLMKFSKRRNLIDRESMVAMYVALALLSTGVTVLAGSDDLLSAFACGTAFAWDDWFSESIEDSNFSNIIDLLVNCATFIFIGATVPFQAYSDPNLNLNPWRLSVLSILILLLRRIPAVMCLSPWIPDMKTRRESLFCAHFGPMGVGAIFISTLAVSRLPTPGQPPYNEMDRLALSIQPITYFLVMSSIIVHGLTIPFFNLGKRVHSISRTWTGASASGEPSWLSRMRRVGDGKDIPSPSPSDEKHDRDLDKAEEGKAEAEDFGVDMGDVDMKDFAATDDTPDFPHSNTTGSDDTNVGSSAGPSKDDGKRAANDPEEEVKKEKCYHDKGGEQRWEEGHYIVIERAGGEDVIVIDKDKLESDPDKYKEDDARLQKLPSHTVREEEHKLRKIISHEGERLEAAAQNAARKYLGIGAGKRRRSSAASTKPPMSTLDQTTSTTSQTIPEVVQGSSSDHEPAPTVASSPQQSEAPKSGSPNREEGTARPWLARGLSMARDTKPKESKDPAEIQAKLDRDAACRKERKDCTGAERSWVQGRHLVIERNKGEDVEVVDLDAPGVRRGRAFGSAAVARSGSQPASNRELTAEDQLAADVIERRRTEREESAEREDAATSMMPNILRPTLATAQSLRQMIQRRRSNTTSGMSERGRPQALETVSQSRPPSPSRGTIRFAENVKAPTRPPSPSAAPRGQQKYFPRH